MNAAEQISLFNTLFYVSMSLTIVGLALAVFFFFYFDIPRVHAMMTGKAKRDTIRKMEEQNAMTGKLRMNYTGYTGETGDPARTGKLGRTGRTGRTGEIQESRIQNPAPAPQQHDQETVTPETAVLQTNAPETEVLYENAGETAILGAAPVQEEAGETAVLNHDLGGFRFQITETTLVIHTNEII